MGRRRGALADGAILEWTLLGGLLCVHLCSPLGSRFLFYLPSAGM